MPPKEVSNEWQENTLEIVGQIPLLTMSIAKSQHYARTLCYSPFEKEKENSLMQTTLLPRKKIHKLFDVPHLFLRYFGEPPTLLDPSNILRCEVLLLAQLCHAAETSIL